MQEKTNKSINEKQINKFGKRKKEKRWGNEARGKDREQWKVKRGQKKGKECRGVKTKGSKEVREKGKVIKGELRGNLR